MDREYLRTFLVVCCVIAILVSAVVVPAMSEETRQSVPGPMQSAEESSGKTTAAGEGAGESGSGSGESSGDATAGGSEAQTGDGTQPSTEAGGELQALTGTNQTRVGGNVSTYRNQGQQVHFVVESPQPSYWRTDTYTRYTTDGWETDRSAQPYDGSVLTQQGERETRILQEFHLRRDSTRLPAAWRPRGLDISDIDSDVEVTSNRVFQTDRPVAAGTTYRVLSYVPPRSPERLRSAGRDYPASIEERYTQLPDSTEQRVRPFVADLTADADSSYETAASIEQWLETNKEYSLDATHSGSGDVATDFIFEMERGYCEYFATAMVVMLRSQDVPARYVTGYSTGQPVDDDTYVVREMNAHAWVEVYFPETGWVRFDPTPGESRLTAESQAFGSDGGEATGSETQGTPSADPSEYGHSETGSPGETFSPEETETTPDSGSDAEESGSSSQSDSPSDSTTQPNDDSDSDPDSDSDSDSDEQDSSSDDATDPETESETVQYNITLNESSPIPGRDVLVTVEADGEPVSDITVLFNGDSVGETGSDGTVTATVPYVEQLNVTATDTSNSTQQALNAPDTLRDSRSPDADRYFDITAPTASALLDAGPQKRAQVVVNETFETATDVSLSVSGRPFAGATVTVNATINGTPIAGATVSVGGEAVAETNRRGVASVPLPETDESTDITVSRGDISETETVAPIARLNTSVAGSLYPGSEATVTVSARGQPVANASVSIADGADEENESLTRTGSEGTATITLPESDGNVTLTAEKSAAAGSTTVDLRELTVHATPTAPIALPWTPLTIRSELNGDPQGDVAIRLNGEPVGETDSNGSLVATLPPSTDVTVAASGYSQRAQTTAGNPLAALGATVIGTLLIGGFLLRRGRRSGVIGRDGLTAIVGFGQRFGQRVLGIVIWGAAGLNALLERAIRILARIRDDVTRLPSMLRRAWQRIRDRTVELAHRAAEIALAASARVRARGARIIELLQNPRELGALLLAWIRTVLDSLGTRSSDTDSAEETSASRRTASTEADPEPRLTIREAWREFLAEVSVRNARTKTPGQIARWAIERDGHPPSAVTSITDAFRDVEYGDRSADERVSGARNALEQVRVAHEEQTGAHRDQKRQPEGDD